MMALNQISNVFFLGIGGIGMSAIARFFMEQGTKVYGYDRTSTPLTNELEQEGMTIFFEDDPKYYPNNLDLVVYTPAIPKNSNLLAHAHEREVRIMKRSEVLGLITASTPSIAVAGTHGKTTTSSIITHLLYSSGVKVTGFVGGIMTNYHSNYVNAGQDYIVVEADEFDRSFLWLHPDISVVLSMDPDHLDIYGHEGGVKEGFKAFIDQTKLGGTTIIHKDLVSNFSSDEWQHIADRYEIITFGHHSADAYFAQIEYVSGGVKFDYHWGDTVINDLILHLPGSHNVSNAVVGITIALKLGVHEDAIRASIKNFKGIHRRFEFIIQNDQHTYIDDYAHHPTELNEAIGALRSMFPEQSTVGVFQPHLFSRTKDFAKGFAEALDKLDIPILMDIYPARELPMEGVTSQIILDKMSNPNKQLLSPEEVIDYVSTTQPKVLITLGAGDIDKIVPTLKEVLS